MNRLYRMVVGLLCFITLSQAQNVTGKVTENNGERIANATIAVLNTNHGTATDEEGNFQLTLPPGAYTLSVSAIGYASAIEPIVVDTSNTVVNIPLEESSTTLDEVVVSAQRTEQNIIKTPVSVTSLSSRKIEDTRIWELEDLNALVPNYYYGEIGVGFQQIQSIRGISVFSENPAIATYIDGVNQLDILANGFQLTDIESIEVLRGPQGTLFGRNAMGGVINIVTKKPTNKTSAHVQVSAGNLGLQRYAFGVKAPLLKNKLYVGLTGLYQSHEGFLRNDTTGTVDIQPGAQGARVGDETSYYGNLHLKWLVNDRFDAALNVKAQLDDSDASNFFIYQANDSLAKANPDQVRLGRVGEHRRDVVNTALSMNYYTPDVTLSSTSTYQMIGLSYDNIYEANPGFGGTFYASHKDGDFGVRSEPQKVFTQELKITSANEKTGLNYTGGVFYFNQTAFEPTTNIGINYGPLVGPVFVPGYTADTYVVFKNNGENYGFAAFGQLSNDITDRLTLTAGFRYDYEKRENTFNGFGDLIYQGGEEIEFKQDTSLSVDFSAFSPKVALSFKPSKTSNAYFSYTRGFRAGGINTQRIQDVDLTFDPEYSDNVEVGYKGNFLQNRLFFASTAYYIHWDDIQFFNQVSPNVFLTDNVGSAISYGLELEMSAIPLKNLQFDAAYGVNESEYQDFTLNSGGETVQLEGNRLANTPTSTLFLGMQYDVPLFFDINLMGRLELRRTGELFSDRENDLVIDPYHLVNTKWGISYRNQLDVSFWVRNLDNQRYIAYASPSTIGGNRNSLSSAPRTYGITFTAKF
ncbi:TonB-dependent receptor [Fulvivirga sp. M361]|uniref:TonB-dependent receptor n=1 Tax=Fulvivirga sp. M361 TaxID=2594266 RepID=UPI001179C338|nr:TonB-dependent receptor [Fulvivirga sp. M361]TRX58817.1 TonB-dependent receptor [Fulvivirga sp. M361]